MLRFDIFSFSLIIEISYMVHRPDCYQNFQGKREYEQVTDLQLLKLSLRSTKLRVLLSPLSQSYDN